MAFGVPLPAFADVTGVAGGPTTVDTFTPSGSYSTGYDVNTSQVRNNVGLNRFDRFNVGSDTHVRLHLPDGSHSLVNLVEGGSRAEVHGLVQGIQNGSVGGNLYFASPAGFLVGAGGVIEAGSLTISTPTDGFLDEFRSDFDSGITGGAVERMLSGDVPLSNAGVIEIHGHLRAERSVLLHSRRVNVSRAEGASEDASITITGDAENRGQELFESLVNTDGFLAGSAIAETEGGALVIVGRDQGVTIGPGATLDAGDGGLLITAADFQRPSGGDTPLEEINDWFKPSRTATAEVTIGGTLRGGDVTIVAAAEAVTEWQTPELESIEDLSPDLYQELSDARDSLQQELPALDGAVAIANADARVTIQDGAVIESGGDVTLEAHAHRSATAEASAEDGKWLGAAAAYGRLSGETWVLVEEGTDIAAPDGTLSLLAASVNELAVSATSSANQSESVSLSGTVAVSEVDVKTIAELNAGRNGGDNRIDVDRVEINAVSDNSYSTEASASAEAGLAIGLAVAVSLIESETRATLSGSLDVGGGLAMLAHSNTSLLKNIASTEAAEASGDDNGDGNGNGDDNGEGEDQLGEWIAPKIGDASDDVAANGDGEGEDTPAAGSDGGLPLKIGSAVAFLEADETATAEVTEGSSINPLPDTDPAPAAGDVTIIARRELGGFTNHATSGTVSEGKDNGSSVSISAAVALAFIGHSATARIGDGADIAAGRLGVAADVLVHPHAEWGEDDGFGSIDDFGGDDADTGNLNSYASASLEGGSDTVSISGAVAYLNLDSRASAGVGNQVTLRTGDADGDWSTALGDGDDAPEIAWDGSLSIQAGADVRTVDLAGGASESGKVGIGGAVAWIDRSTTAEAVVGYDGVLESAGDVRVAAQRRDDFIVLAPVSGKGAGEDSTVSLNAAVAYGRLRGLTLAELGNGTTVDADGAFSLLADTAFTADVTTVSTLEDGGTFALSGTVAYADLSQNTAARRGTTYAAGYVPVPGAENRISAGSVIIAATQEASYNVSATAKAESQVAVGLAAAVADIFSDTHAGLAGTVETDGDVVVLADSLTGTKSLSAETSAAAPSDDDDDDTGDNGEVQGEVAQDGTSATDFAQRRSDSADSKAGDSVAASEGGSPAGGGGTGSGDSSFDLRLSGAAAILLSEESARATVADGAVIGSIADRAGDVVVLARRQENGLYTRVNSATEAKVDDDGTGVAVSAAVSFVELYNQASALVGADVVIAGERIGIGSLVALPDHFRPPGMDDVPDWQEHESLDSFRQQAVENGEELVESWFTTYASATASSENSTVDVAGAVNYLGLQSLSEAWVDDGAVLDAASAEGDWEYVLTEADEDEGIDEDAWAFQEVITVIARSDISTIDLAGNLAGLTGFGVDANGTTAAIGGAFAWAERSNTTVAGLGAGVTVNVPDGDLLVEADASDQAITLAPTSGRGADYAVNGTVAVTRTDHLTVASVHNSANVTAAGISLLAGQDLTIWSVAGAVSLGQNLGVGLGSAVNDLSTHTIALIGDNSDYRPEGLVDAVGAGESGDQGLIRADAVNVDAATHGLVGTAAVAGAQAGGQQSQDSASDSARGGFDSRTSDAQDGAAGASADDALEGPADSLVSGQTDGDQSLSGSGSSDSEASFSIAVSGSAAVNLTELNTDAVVDGADIAGRDADAVTVRVQALNTTDQLALAGAGALVRDSGDSGGGSGGGFTAAIAGAVAVNQLENITRARVLDSSISQVGAGADEPGVSVRAMTAGELIGVGLGLAVDTDSGDSSLTVAGSVSLGMLRNQTTAEVDGSMLTGEGGDEAVQVVAYDRSRIATGGGALTYGGRVGLGVAVTYADIANQTRAAVTDSNISEFSALDIGAFSASRIISAAAGLQVSTDGNQGVNIAGSVAVNRIRNNVIAELGGEAGSTVTVDGDVTVQAASVSGSGFDSLLADLDSAGGGSGRHDVNWSGEGTEVAADGSIDSEDTGAPGGSHEDQGDIDQQYAGFVADASVGGVLDGEAILGIAGNIQAGKNQNSIGLSFNGNFIDNVYEARIDNATVTADTVTVDAIQSARILGIAAGAAITTGKFAGLGSGVANIIGLDDDAGRVHASISDATINADNINVRGLNRSRIDAAAGNVAYSSKASFGAAIGYNEIATSTLATVADSTLRGRDGDGTAADTLRVAALATGDIYAIAVAGSASQQVALAGSGNINRLNQQVSALVDGSTLTVADVDVSAGNRGLGSTAEIWALTGNVTVGGKAAVGASFAWNEIGNQYSAVVSDTDFEQLETLNVSAESSGKIRTLTAAGAFSQGSLAVTGAGSYSVISAGTSAVLENSGISGDSALVQVLATDDADIASIAASLAVTTSSAAGAGAIAVNEMQNSVTADVQGGSGNRTLGVDTLLVDALSATDIFTVAAGVGASAKVGLAGSAASNLVDTDVLARIAGGARVEAAGDVAVRAASNDQIQLIAGSLGIGVKALGAAATVAVNMLDGSTQALIEGADTHVAAQGGSGVGVGSGSLTGQRSLIDYDAPGDDPAQSTVDEAALSNDYVAGRLAESTETVRGVSVNAGSLQSVGTYIATAGINPNVKSGAALAGAVSVNLLERQTTAAVRDATIITTDADLLVRASAHAESRSLVIGAALSSVGAAGAVASDVFDRSTTAEIVHADVTAGGDVTVDAVTTQTANAMAFGAAAGTWAGVAGGGVLMLMEGENTARVSGGSIDADSLLVNADYSNVLNLTTANLAISGGGAGAGSFAVGVVESTNTAQVADAGLVLADSLVIQADTWNELHTIAASGAASAGGSVAGMASVSIIGSETYAYLDDSTVNGGVDGGDTAFTDLVRISASDSLATRSYGGGLSFGQSGMALGASATVVIGKATVAAASRDSHVHAEAMEVDAERQADVEAYTLTAALGGGVSIGAGVGVILLGGSGAAGVDTVDDPEANSQQGLMDELDNGNGSTLAGLDDFGSGQLQQDSGDDTNQYGEIGVSAERQDRLTGATSYQVGSTVRDGGEHETRATVSGGSITAGSLEVTASEGNRTINAGGALAAGSAGVGGAAAVTHVASVVRATVDSNVTLTGSGGLQVNAGSGATAALIGSAFNLNHYINNAGSLGGDITGDRTILVLAAAGGAGIAGMGAAYADGQARSTVTAHLGGQVNREAGISAPVNLSAGDANSIGSYGIGAGVGAAAVGLVVGFAEKTSVVEAAVLDGAGIIGAGVLTLDAEAGGLVTARGAAAAGGLAIAGSGSIIIAEDNVTARSRIGNGVQVQDASAVTLTADARPRTDVKAYAGNLGSVAIGVSYAEALANATAETLIGNGVVFSGAAAPVSLSASTAPRSSGVYAAQAEAWAAGGGQLLAANGAIARARDNTSARAEVGDDVRFETGGNVTVSADARPAARADAHGYAGAGVAAFGGAWADARSAAYAGSLLGDGVLVAGEDAVLTLDARVRRWGGLYSARAEATTGAGAGLVGLVGARATASTTTTAESVTGSGLRLPGGSTVIEAGNLTSQYARGRGFAGAAIAVGLVDVRAQSNTSTTALLGHSAQADQDRAGDITIRARGENVDQAHAVSGTGGVIAGSAAEARTTSNGTALAAIAECGPGCPEPADVPVLQAGRVTVDARHTNTFQGTVNSRSAHLAGYSGAKALHTANASATARVGKHANLDLLYLDLDAATFTTQVFPGINNANISVGSGGALNASAGQGRTVITGTALVDVADGARVRTFRLSDTAGEGDIRMRARNQVSAYQYGKLDTGGVIDIPRVDISSEATLTGEIRIGEGADVGAARDLNVAAYNAGSMEARANIRTHGLAGAAAGTTAATLISRDNVNVHEHAVLAASRNAFVAAGLDASGNVPELSAVADTYIWNKTAFPVETDPTADALLRGNNHITVHEHGSIIAGRDVDMMTTWQEYRARGVGIGKDLWREVAEKVTNTVVKVLTFGQVKEAVSLEIRKGTSVVTDQDSITVNGAVIGGAAAYQYLWIRDQRDADGNLIIESSLGVNYEITERNVFDDLEAQLLYYETLMQQYADDASPLFWRAYAQAHTIKGQLDALADILKDADGNLVGDPTVQAVELKDIATRGGNVTLHTGTLTGGGRVSLGDVPNWSDVAGAPAGALNPSSALSVNLVNESDVYLYVGDIEMGSTVGSIVLQTRTNSAFGFGPRYQFTQDLTRANSFGGLQIGGGSGDSLVPEVRIVNTWNGPGLGEGEAFLRPEIHLLGNITNRGGAVRLGNTLGSIIVSGNIEADTIQITAGGSFIQNFTTGFTHVGGTPDANNIPESESQIVAGGAIYINGEYVNINGLVRSGVAEYALTITQDDLDAALANASEGDTQIYLSGQFDDGMPNLNELRAYYDTEEDMIVVRRAEVRPGYIFIFGDVVSTGGGRLEAVSGYGDITLDNQTGKAVVLEGLDVGTGGNGVIEILDMGYAELPDNLPADSSGPPQEGEVVAIPSPRRTVYTHLWEQDRIQVDTSFLTVSLGGEEGEPNRPLDVLERVIGDPDYLNGRSTAYQPVEGRYWVVQNELAPLAELFRFWGIDVPIPVIEGAEILAGDPSGAARSMAADHAIDINFLGGSEGRLSVTSTGDVRLAGELRNLDGLVAVDTHGALLNPGLLGGIVADRIEVSARTGIGSDVAPLQLEVGDGAVHAVTTRGDVHLRGRGSDLLIDHVRSDRGDLYIYSRYDILDAGLHAEAAVKGRSITLESLDGSIGSADQLLRIQTGHFAEDPLQNLTQWFDLSWFLGGYSFLGIKLPVLTLPEVAEPAPLQATLTAAAETGAYIEEMAGDLHVNVIDVRNGDVVVKVRDGSLINALGRGELDLDRLERLVDIWEDMRLLGDDAEAAALESVEGYQEAIVTQYHEYWQLRDFLEADPQAQAQLENVFSGRYLDAGYADVLASRVGDAAEAAALLDSLTGDTTLETVMLRAAHELERLEGVLTSELGVDDLAQAAGFDQRDDNWTFVLDENDARYAAIVEGAVWTEQELLNSINAEALIDIDSTLYERVQPNIVGNNVTIDVADSAGSFDEPIRIELPGDDTDPGAYPSLTEQQIAALLAAQPGDITFEGGTFNAETGEFEGNITAIIINRTLVIGVNVGDEDAGGLTVDAGENAFIVSPFQQLRLDGINAPGDVRIQARGDIVAADHGQPVITGAAGGLLLEAEGGSIGSADRAIYVNLDAPLITARAAEGIYLVEQSGDLRIDRMNTLAGTLYLAAEDGSIIARDDDLLDLLADDIRLEASGDVTGGAGDSGFNGINVQHGDNGHVGGTAGGVFRVANLEGGLLLQDVEAGGEVSVLARDLLTADDVEAGGSLRLESQTGSVLLDRVQAWAGGADAVTVIAADQIQGLNPTGVVGPAGLSLMDLDGLDYHLAARGDLAEVRLLAGDDIGRQDQHLTVVAPVLDAFSGNGSVWITALETVLSGSVDASNGAMALYGRDGLGMSERMELYVRDRLDLRANDVRANVHHTANPSMLPMDLQRIDGGALNTAELWVDAPNGLAIGRLHGREILLETSARRMEVPDGRVLDWFEYRTPRAHVYMNNVGAPRHPDANVHLYQPDFDFFLIQDGRFTYTNSYVVYYGPGYEVRVPNYVPDHRDTRRDVDGRSGERQSSAWSTDHTDGERWQARNGGTLIDFAALLAAPDGWTFRAPENLSELEDGGIVQAAFGEPLRDRQAIELRERRAQALRQLADMLESHNVLFDFDSAELSANDQAFLDYVAGVLADQPERRVRIEGYTDALGEMRYNRQLSEARAAAVRAYLEARGVSSEQMDIIGVGPENAVASNDTEEGRQLNRRVEISLLP